LETEAVQLRSQINSFSSLRDFSKGTVVVKIQSDRSIKIDVALSYIVENAGWLPTYDIKAENINSPLELVYKANVRQDTKIDWKDVKIRLSTADPNLSGVKPELKTYYLNYTTAPPNYKNSFEQVSGIVTDGNREPLPGVTIVVEGTTIGTTTDFDGRYSLTLPNQQGNLVFSYIGFNTVTRAISNSVINVAMEESSQALEEVVVTGYSGNERNIDRVLQGKAAGLLINEDEESSVIPITQIDRQITVDFEVDIPYTVLSDNKSYSIDMIKHNLPASYKYYSVPKIEPAAYLTANLTNWEQYNLLEGEANLYFEDTFVGKTILDTRAASDTLQISLGRDKNISVQRKKIADYSSKKFIGTRKEELRQWQINIKNNKNERVSMEIFDQVPVATLDEINVEIEEKSKGTIDSETGEIKWEVTIDPRNTMDLTLKYLVKYPKNKMINSPDQRV
jgi:hypothetical protein